VKSESQRGLVAVIFFLSLSVYTNTEIRMAYLKARANENPLIGSLHPTRGIHQRKDPILKPVVGFGEISKGKKLVARQYEGQAEGVAGSTCRALLLGVSLRSTAKTTGYL
jgi:hypothetical protein